MSPPASCFRGAHRLLPGCNQLHAVHPALRRHAGKLFYWSLLYSIRLYGYVIYIYILCIYIYYVYIYIYYMHVFLSFSLSLLCYISSKRDNKHDESTDLSNIQIRNMVLKINRHVLPSQGFNRPPNKFWCCRNLKAMLLGPEKGCQILISRFWKWMEMFVCTDAKF